MTTQQAAQRAKTLEGVIKKEHFGSEAFVANGRMFATVWHDQEKVNLRLSSQDQRKFLISDGEAFEKIDNAWGKQGWTCVNIKFIEVAQFMEALKCAWIYSAQKTPGANLNTTRAEQKKAKRQALAPLKKLERKKSAQAKKQLARSEKLKEKVGEAGVQQASNGTSHILTHLNKEHKIRGKKR